MRTNEPPNNPDSCLLQPTGLCGTPMASNFSPKSDAYVLGRDFKSASRLNYQQYLWYETLHFNLHPTIQRNIPDSSNEGHDPQVAALPLRIADIACGSGAWLRSVAQELPQAELDGFDLSLAQCPPNQWLPSNIRLQQWNLFDEPAFEMLGRYDVVHTRLIFTVVQDEDARPIINSLMRLLKPGGWLQWDELNVEHSFLMRVETGVQAPVMEKMLEVLKKKGKWVSRLPESMGECGLCDVALQEFEEREDLAKAFFDNNLAKDEEMAQNALKGTEEGTRLLDMVMRMFEESMGGVVICTPKIVCSARKRRQEN